MFIEIEAGLAVVALVLAFTVPNLGARWFEAIEGGFGRLAKRRALSVLVVGLTALALRAALLPILPIPQPLVQDEFAYLLAADTFAHGRLTNPTPPMWIHFESLMVIMKPTYNSKYPPAQSLFLAAGQVILGHPFRGVWLSVGLMCAAICWMLQPWVGEGWALLGGFLAVIRLGTFSYWANSYWGGAVPAVGGALVLGALPRLKHKLRVRDALLMGLGFAILANSRPYEGLVLSLPVAAALFVWMLGSHRPAFSISLREVVLPLCLLMGLTAAGMGYYNWRVTGDPLRMPYQVYQAQYDPTPYFLWQSQKPLPKYAHPEMEEWEKDIDLRLFKSTRSLGGLLGSEGEKALALWLFYVGPVFTLTVAVTFATLPYGFSWKDFSAPSRFLVLAFGVSLVGLALEVYIYDHYAAPITCLFFALALLAMRRFYTWRARGRRSGLFLVRSVPIIAILLLLLRTGVAPLHLRPNNGGWTPWFTYNDMFPVAGRRGIIAELHRQPGRDLVLVRYSPGLFYKISRGAKMWPPWGVMEWVYNGADINDQKVIWAQDMGPSKNEELIHYYKARRVWLLYADDQPPRLVPYTEAVDRSSPAASEKTPPILMDRP